MDIIKEIVRENGFSESETEDTVASIGIIADMSARSPRKVILNLKQIKENLLKDKVIINEISFFCGKPIYVSHDLYVKTLLDGISHTMQNDSRQICLAGTPYLDRIGNTDIIVKEDTEFHIIKIDSSNEIIVTADTDYFDVPMPYAAEDDQTAANDLAEDGWEEEIPVGAAKTDEGKTDEGVTG